ncbi:hypothetical protein GOODEAATRI_021111 [Goodea atripinnis]|uniref:Uncharacterized protein n=1 Tax=Goodea atripinnis TaxID=208336 RepID=A0ABV0P6L5_9TELE
MFRLSSSSTAGLWLSLLRKNTRITFWTILRPSKSFSLCCYQHSSGFFLYCCILNSTSGRKAAPFPFLIFFTYAYISNIRAHRLLRFKTKELHLEGDTSLWFHHEPHIHHD